MGHEDQAQGLEPVDAGAGRAQYQVPADAGKEALASKCHERGCEPARMGFFEGLPEQRNLDLAKDQDQERHRT